MSQKITSQGFVDTNLGKIFYEKKVVGKDSLPPVIFLHGVYFDHHLWDYHTELIQDRTTITIDMPNHGLSDTHLNWDMDQVSLMLIKILDELGIDQCYAIGHSWGSMTILRAAEKNPERFIAIGLCNMPLNQGGRKTQKKFGRQHLALSFRKFYMKQAAKGLFGKSSLSSNPNIKDSLYKSMALMQKEEIIYTDEQVIMYVDDGYQYLTRLKVPAESLVGTEDYVPHPTSIPCTIIKGGHVSPLESPKEVGSFVRKILMIEPSNKQS